MAKDAAGFQVELLSELEAFKIKFRNHQASIAADAYGYLVEISPIITGGYTNEHVIENGNEEIIYESPVRVGHDFVIENPDEYIQKQDPAEAAAALAEMEPFSNVKFVNERFYSEKVEAIHHVYELVEVAMEADVESRPFDEGENDGSEIPF